LARRSSFLSLSSTASSPSCGALPRAYAWPGLVMQLASSLSVRRGTSLLCFMTSRIVPPTHLLFIASSSNISIDPQHLRLRHPSPLLSFIRRSWLSLFRPFVVVVGRIFGL
jgi:hypothetical protein